MTNALLVEDYDLDARLVEIALSKSTEGEFTLHRVKTLDEAIQAPENQRIDIVLLDLSLPDAKHLEGLNAFHERFPSLPIIVLTATSDAKLAVDAIEAGAEDFLYKDDFNQKFLRRSIRYAIERNKTRMRMLELERRMHEILRLESLGTLAGGIAHDFNNVLTSVMGSISLLYYHVEPDSEASQLLNDASTALERAKHLSHQLLALSQRGYMEIRPTNVSELISSTIPFLKSNANISFDVQQPDDLWPVKADANQIVNVLHNVVINSIEAQHYKGIVRIKAYNTSIGIDGTIGPLQPGNYVVISIEDDGDGITSEHLARIFDPYFTTKGEGRGTGLANAISIIKQHKGWIAASSEPGKGTTVDIYLPALPGAALSKKKETSKVVQGSGRVLLMDDDLAVQRSVSYMIKKLGYEVEIATEGGEALKMFQKAIDAGTPYDLLILDLTVPGGMGGKEVIKRTLEIDKDVVAVVASGYSDDDVLSNYESYGFKAKLPKPFTLAQLSNVLSDLIGKRRA